MLLSPTGETQFIGLYAPEHSKSSDSGQHLSHPCYPHAVWTQSLALDLQWWPYPFLPHCHLPCAKAWKSPFFPRWFAAGAPSPTHRALHYCIGTIQTKILRQLVTVLPVYFFSKFFPSLPLNFKTTLMRQTLSGPGPWKTSGFLPNGIFCRLQSGTPYLCTSDTKQRLAKTRQLSSQMSLKTSHQQQQRTPIWLFISLLWRSGNEMAPLFLQALIAELKVFWHKSHS